jgi:hypothetical protein
MGALRDSLPLEVLAIGSLRADTYRGGQAMELHVEQLHDG